MLWIDLTRLFYSSIHGRTTIPELAQKMGVSENLLYRTSLAYSDTPSAAPPTLKNTILLMQATGDFRILKYLCNYFGFMCIRHPRVGRNRKSAIEQIGDLQQHHLVCHSFLLDMYQNPTKENRRNCVKALYACIEFEAGIMKRIQHDNLKQTELPLVERQSGSPISQTPKVKG